MAKTKDLSSSDPKQNDIPDMSFDEAMSIIARTPKKVVDESMKEFKNRGKKYVDIKEPNESKPKKKSPK